MRRKDVPMRLRKSAGNWVAAAPQSDVVFLQIQLLQQQPNARRVVLDDVW
jgi:hypothetical protein